MKVRVIKKGKTRGRPSKVEITMAKVMNWYLEKPKIKRMMRKIIEDACLKGTGMEKMKW